ncbi:MAG: SDR family NAD(P)-dependent oxidoreductase [Leucothrix sp.]
MNLSILDRESSVPSPFKPKTVLVVGATGGIGQAFCQQVLSQFPDAKLIRMARSTDKLPTLDVPTQDIAIDLTREVDIETAIAELPEKIDIDWVFIATGWLHDDTYQPEKSYRSLSAEHLALSYQINAFGPALVIKHLLARLNPKHPVVFGVLTARVGSISDNRMGGWYSYRSSKAALNMLIKNFAIECSRSRRPLAIIGLQPGTTDTALSAPFQRGVSPENLQSPKYTAGQLVTVMGAVMPEDSGSLFDFLGLPFDP